MSALTWAVAAVVTDDTGRVLLCRQGRGERRYALPGGRVRPAESPVRAALRDIHAETGWDIDLVDLIGIYQLSGAGGGAGAGAATVGANSGVVAPAGRAGPLPDVLVHVFRARVGDVRPVADPAAGCRLSWHAPADLPETVTPLTRAAVADAVAGHSGVLRHARWSPATVSPRGETGPDNTTGPDARTGPDGGTRPDGGSRPDDRTRPDDRPGLDRDESSVTGHPPEQRGETDIDRSLHP
jgi:8-oxo-dGTP pyrophosphatase MutT (NUDIX family)